MLTIHLGQDENDCFSAWVSAKETGLAENDAVDQKGNIYSFMYMLFFYYSYNVISFFSFSFSELWKSFTASFIGTLVEAITC